MTQFSPLTQEVVDAFNKAGIAHETANPRDMLAAAIRTIVKECEDTDRLFLLQDISEVADELSNRSFCHRANLIQ